MNYINVIFEASEQEERDLLIALLSDIGYDGFEEKGNELYAYIEDHAFDENSLTNNEAIQNIPRRIEMVPSQNWNALWEANFHPVVVADFCTIRAHFHQINVETPYDIIITPKMSFGTGHHATTQLMMMEMKNLSFMGKSVLDFGTGTGVLAILAEMLGAEKILAIDNDKWSVENAEENINRNHCGKIQVNLASLETAGSQTYDIILANINRHILLQYMADLYGRLNENGMILMSGLLLQDKEIILEAAREVGFHDIKFSEQNNWIALLFARF